MWFFSRDKSDDDEAGNGVDDEDDDDSGSVESGISVEDPHPNRRVMKKHSRVSLHNYQTNNHYIFFQSWCAQVWQCRWIRSGRRWKRKCDKLWECWRRSQRQEKSDRFLDSHFSCLLGTCLAKTELIAKLKIQGIMTISKTARFFLLITLWILQIFEILYHNI